MTRILILAAAASTAAVASANAAVPFFNATCPTGIEVHADEGGPIYINGKEATLKVFNKNAYEAKHGHVTLDLTIAPDGTPSLTYTKDGGANGICTVAREHVSGANKGGNKHQSCPPGVAEANRYKYPGCK